MNTRHKRPIEVDRYEEAAEYFGRAFYDWNKSVYTRGEAIGNMTPNYFYGKLTGEHGEDAEPSILFLTERFKVQGSIPSPDQY